ncbi:Inactive purple acid phosphatase-like protein [Quillaja saponaria]|uniref:Inactive purple acid phosphatase-like protein n=1 Tax=Quillaja saponaria TaxID=32244 RepID=A0AAD7PJY5_QUISA|nr:Inactive purple acid phosphatase-like protein [Quillaja saponaria]
MEASSRGFSAQFDFKLRRLNVRPVYDKHILDLRKRRRRMCDGDRVGASRITSCCSESVVPIRRKTEEWQFHSTRVRDQASPAMPFASPQSHLKQEKFYPRCNPRNSGPQSRDSPPKRNIMLVSVYWFLTDTGIANEKDWGIDLLNENVNVSGTNEDGSTWYRESGEEMGENGNRCRWTRMGGQSHDGSSEWKETVHFIFQ